MSDGWMRKLLPYTPVGQAVLLGQNTGNFLSNQARHLIDEGFDFLSGGDRVLVGPRFIFPEELRDGFIASSAGRLESLIREAVSSSSSWVQSGVHSVLNTIHSVGDLWDYLTEDTLFERLLDLVRSGQIIIAVVPNDPPDLSKDQGLAKFEELTANMSAGLLSVPGMPAGAGMAGAGLSLGEGLINVDIKDATFEDLDTTGRKVAWAIKRSGRYMGAELSKMLDELFSWTTLAALGVIVAVIIVLLCIPGVNIGIATILTGLGFIMLGWTILELLYRLYQFGEAILTAESLNDLEEAAQIFARIIVALGFDALLTLLTFGLGKAAKLGNKAAKAGGALLRKGDGAAPPKRNPKRSPKAVPKGFEGTGYRYTDPKWKDTAFDPHPGNTAANHRYSGPGDTAIYSGGKPETALAEISAYGPVDGKILVSKPIKLDNALDLTDPKVRADLGVTLDDLTKIPGQHADAYKVPQDLAAWARANGYDGMLVPSARDPGGFNIVDFKP